MHLSGEHVKAILKIEFHSVLMNYFLIFVLFFLCCGGGGGREVSGFLKQLLLNAKCINSPGNRNQKPRYSL